MKSSVILKEARKLIEDGNESYICHTISRVIFGRYWFELDDTSRSHPLKTWISRQLGNFNTYESWLRYNHRQIYSPMSPKDIREGRSQWLDHMISVCEQQEVEINE